MATAGFTFPRVPVSFDEKVVCVFGVHLAFSCVACPRLDCVSVTGGSASGKSFCEGEAGAFLLFSPTLLVLPLSFVLLLV